jgi:dienelactone hydrolase
MKIYSEKTVSFDLPHTDGLQAEGKLLGELDRPVVVIMHGRPGNINMEPYYQFSRYVYEELGMSALRLAMYSFSDRTRNLLDCTLATNIADFEAVVAGLYEQGAEDVAAVGHSYGAAAALGSRANLFALSAWDSFHGSYLQDNKTSEGPSSSEVVEGEYVIGRPGNGWMYSATNLAHDMELGDTSHWAANHDYSTQIISAGKGALQPYNKRYYQAGLEAGKPIRHDVIPGASHGFADSDAVMDKLFKTTGDFLAASHHGAR